MSAPMPQPTPSAGAPSPFASMTAAMGSVSLSGGGGQSLQDRVNAARYALAGQGLARVVCKATTEELQPPKKKHLDYLLQCTHEPSVSIPSLANLLIERAISPSSSWVVVFKSLTSLHHLMCYGNERFSAYLASAPEVGLQALSLQWTDRTATVGGPEMAPFVRRYASYVLARISSYRSVGYDFAKVKRTAAPPQPVHRQAIIITKTGPPVIADLSLDQVMTITPLIQTQIDSLLAFDARSSTDLRNAVIRGAFLLLFRDLVRLFACYNDCIISLLQKFFSINERKTARTALSLYVSFTERMERVAGFLRVAESIGVEKGEIPDLARAPASLLNALEAHCATLEGKSASEIQEILDRKPPPPPPPPPQPVPVVAQVAAVPPGRPPPAAFNPFLAAEPEPQAPPVPPAPQVPVVAQMPPVVPPPPVQQPVAPPPVPPQPAVAVNPYAAAAGIPVDASVVTQPIETEAPAAAAFNPSNPFA